MFDGVRMRPQQHDPERSTAQVLLKSQILSTVTNASNLAVMRSSTGPSSTSVVPKKARTVVTSCPGTNRAKRSGTHASRSTRNGYAALLTAWLKSA